MKSQAVRTPMQLARLLNGQRKEQGLSQKKAAAKVGMAPKTISALENHPEGSCIESLFKLLSALDLEIVLQPKLHVEDRELW